MSINYFILITSNINSYEKMHIYISMLLWTISYLKKKKKKKKEKKKLQIIQYKK